MGLSPDTQSNVKQARIASIVILVTFPCWLGITYLGGKLGWQTSYVFLADLSAIAAFIWALVVLFKVWRNRQKNEE